MIVEVFKTSVNDADIATIITKQLLALYPSAKINFDLDDSDNVLRIENNSTIPPDEVMQVVEQQGCFCEVLF
ncbi:MAG: methyltransferase type 11 [Bacteroidia bacterium]